MKPQYKLDQLSTISVTNNVVTINPLDNIPDITLSLRCFKIFVSCGKFMGNDNNVAGPNALNAASVGQQCTLQFDEPSIIYLFLFLNTTIWRCYYHIYSISCISMIHHLS